MAFWNELLNEINAINPEKQGDWLRDNLIKSLQSIQKHREDRNVLVYASSFLQKPGVSPNNISINQEEINGYMTTLNGMDWDRGLTLILHTPGGVVTAAETIAEYLRAKFKYIEVIVPTFAMSAGTMISLSSDRIIMGRQSQLGPIDPQMPVNGGKFVSALAILDQFEKAKADILKDRSLANVWAPILPSLGPALISEATHAIDYSEKIVSGWLSKYMFNGMKDGKSKAQKVAEYFSQGSTKRNHGRRIDRNEGKGQGLIIEDLEQDQQFQDAVLTNYHLLTILFEKTPTTKILMNNKGIAWTKSQVIPQTGPPNSASHKQQHTPNKVHPPKHPQSQEKKNPSFSKNFKDGLRKKK